MAGLQMGFHKIKQTKNSAQLSEGASMTTRCKRGYHGHKSQNSQKFDTVAF